MKAWWRDKGRWWFDFRFKWWQFKRAWKMARADWGTSDGDWSTIGEPLRHSIRRVRLHMSEHQIVANWERDCKQMLIAETLLTRMLDDNYSDLATSEFTPYGSSGWAKRWTYLQQQDQRYLGMILGKYLNHWWD